jgi:hypothetical protein
MLLNFECPDTCPICGEKADALPATTRTTTMLCPNCIKYTISWSADTPDDPRLQNLLSIAAKQAAEAGQPLDITQDSIREFIQTHGG